MDMVNQETGQRGFLLTGLEASLEPYRGRRSKPRINILVNCVRLLHEAYDSEENLKKNFEEAIKLGKWLAG